MNAPLQNQPRKRCAVYTRKSNEEGLDQDYNSLDAQRDAGQAFIASQRNEGWIPVADNYDDPAYSGGNMERPGLKRLMADIVAGKVDVVVVYKIDRLSRSLADFAKMVELFDQCSVTFISVTQQFNTTTSMGRLTLNILLSFAQFEREVTGERIRDKIAASKKKGMWMGGHPPLGYGVLNRMLVIEEQEAQVVRRIFTDFAKLRSTTELARQLTEEGITTKAWTTQDGRHFPGKRIDKKYLYKVLRNRAYVGEIGHKGVWYPGQHEAIIDRGLWEEVQAIVSADAKTRELETKERGRTDALLRGLLFTPTGEKMQPTYTRKNGKQYRYYVSKSEQRFGAAARTFARLPAELVEGAVITQVKAALSSPEAIQAVWNHLQADYPEIDEATAVVSMSRLSGVWERLFTAEQHRIVNLMIERVDLVTGGVRIAWRKLGWQALVVEFKPNSIGAELLEMEGAV